MKHFYTLLLLTGIYFSNASGTETLLTYNFNFDTVQVLYGYGYTSPVSCYLGNNQMLTGTTVYNYDQFSGYVGCSFRVMLHDLNGNVTMQSQVDIDTASNYYPQLCDVGKIPGGGYYVYGVKQINTSSQNLTDLILIKLNNDGTLAWNSRVLLPDFPYTTQSHIKVRMNSAGDFFLNGLADHGMAICKVSSNGNFAWGKTMTFDSTSKGNLPDLNVVNDSTVILAGTPTYSDISYVSINTNTGAINWAKNFQTNDLSTPTAIIPTFDGNVVAGTSAYPAGTTIWKLDVHGDILWRKVYNVSGQNFKMIELGDGTLMAAASSTGTPVTLMHLDATGNILEKKVVLGASYVTVSELVKDGNDFVLSANVTSSLFANPDLIVIKASSISDLCETLNTPVTASNATDIPVLSGTESDVIVHSLNSDNSASFTADNTVAYSVTQRDYCSYVLPVNTVPAEEAIQIFPVPALNEINIQLSETPTTPTVVKIFDINGNLILQQTLQQQRTALSVSSLAAGVYLAEIKTQQATVVRRIIKM